MDDLQATIKALLTRIAALEAEATESKARIAELEAENMQLRARNAELESQLAEMTLELQRRKKGFRPKPNARARAGKKKDRRRKGQRVHPGEMRPPVDPGADVIHHDLRLGACPDCDIALEDTGEFDDRLVEDIPAPRIETHRYRRHEQCCPKCRKVFRAEFPPHINAAYIGPRARLLVAYCRGHLGISLGKTTDLLDQLFGLRLSRAGALGHIRWASDQFDPVLRKLLALLRTESIVHADETGWRINGKNVWMWCFCNPRLALFLVDHHRSAEVVRRALGESIPGVLITDFYAAYSAIDCPKQKCLAHLLRELHTLREDASPADVEDYLQPLITLFQDAIELAKSRATYSTSDYAAACQGIEGRLDVLIFSRPEQADCNRINKRLVRHRSELLVFLENPAVPADNNEGERTIRSVAATRSDGGVNRTDWGAEAFANIKSIVATCRKNGRRFLDFAMDLLNSAPDSQPSIVLDNTS